MPELSILLSPWTSNVFKPAVREEGEWIVGFKGQTFLLKHEAVLARVSVMVCETVISATASHEDLLLLRRPQWCSWWRGGWCVYTEAVKDVSSGNSSCSVATEAAICAQREPRQTLNATFSPVHILWFLLRQLPTVEYWAASLTFTVCERMMTVEVTAQGERGYVKEPQWLLLRFNASLTTGNYGGALSPSYVTSFICVMLPTFTHTVYRGLTVIYPGFLCCISSGAATISQLTA